MVAFGWLFYLASGELSAFRLLVEMCRIIFRISQTFC